MAQMKTRDNVSGSEDAEQLWFAVIAGAKQHGITTSDYGFSISYKLNKYHLAKQFHSCLTKKKIYVYTKIWMWMVLAIYS